MPICVILSIRTIFPNPMLRLELFFYKGDLRPGENILFILRAPTYIRFVPHLSSGPDWFQEKKQEASQLEEEISAPSTTELQLLTKM